MPFLRTRHVHHPVIGLMTGVAHMTFGASGTLRGTGALSGTATMTWGSSAVLSGNISGSTSMAFACSGTLTGSGKLQGTAAMVFACSATASSGNLAGTAAMTFGSSATLRGNGALSGTAAMSFGTSASLGDGSGWTTFTQTGSDRIIYVSNSVGNDANSGLVSGSPVKSLATGYGLLRSGFADWMLLKAGDTWTGADFPKWQKNGRSAAQPMVIGKYGAGPRPVVITTTNGTGLWIVDTSDNVWVTHLEMYPQFRDTTKPDFDNTAAQGTTGFGVRFYNGVDNCGIEGCFVHHYNTNISAEGKAAFGGTGQRVTNMKVRRNIIVDSFNVGASHSQGLYHEDVNGSLIEENIFVHNGWNLAVTGAIPTIFNHNMYISHPLDNITIRKNLSCYASAMACKTKAEEFQGCNNMLIEDNLGYSCPLGVSLGGVNAPAGAGNPAGGLMFNICTIQRNVMANLGRNTTDTNDQHQGYDLASGVSVTFDKNICIDSPTPGTSDFGVRIENFPQTNVVVSNNVFKNFIGNTSNLRVELDTTTGVTASGNTSPNGASSNVTVGSYHDATVTVNGYATSLGLGFADFPALIAAARLMSVDNWDPRLTGGAVAAYIKAGLLP